MVRRVYFGVIEAGSSGYGIYFPDFPGCVSAGETLEELSTMAQEGLQLHIDGMVEDGHPIPLASAPDLEAERTMVPEAYLQGMLAIEIQLPATPDHVLVDVKTELVREIADRSRVNADHLNARQFIEQAVRRELDRLKKSA